MTLTKAILLFAAFSLFTAQLERGCAMDPNGGPCAAASLQSDDGAGLDPHGSNASSDGGSAHGSEWVNERKELT